MCFFVYINFLFRLFVVILYSKSKDMSIDDEITEYQINDMRFKTLKKIVNLKWVKKQINKLLWEISKTKYDSIPLGDIFDVVEKYGLIPIQEDDTKWGGILCGDNEQIYITVAFKSSEIEKDGCKFYEPIKTTILNISWYKYTTGRYEITTYLS